MAPADYIRWRTLYDAGRLDEAADFCRERHESARTEAEQVCWTKDHAIVKRASGLFWEAYDLHRAILPAVSRLTGSFRARCEQGFARSLETVGRLDDALLRYAEGRYYAEGAGDHIVAARIDTNTGRCLTTALRPADSYELFDRALLVAVNHNDLLLQGEIHESIARAFEAEGRYEEGFQAAARSVAILSETPFEAAYLESTATRSRLREKGRVTG